MEMESEERMAGKWQTVRTAEQLRSIGTVLQDKQSIKEG